MPLPAPPQELKGALEDLIRRWVFATLEAERVSYYATLRIMEQYFKGNQKLVPNWILPAQGVADYVPLKQALANKGQLPKNEAYKEYIINEFRGDIRKEVAVLGQKSPNSTCSPRWADDEEHQQRATLARDVNGFLSSYWDVDSLQRYLAFSAAKNGTSFIYTPLEADGETLGYEEIPTFDEQELQLSPDTLQCPQCQFTTENVEGPQSCPNCNLPLDNEGHLVPGEKTTIPTQTGVKRVPRVTVKCYVLNGWNCFGPFNAKKLDDCPWWGMESEENAGRLLRLFPGTPGEDGRGSWEEELIRGLMTGTPRSMGSSSSQIGIYGRLEAQSPTGYILNPGLGQLLWTRIWLEPSMYEYLKREKPECYNYLETNFPSGCKVNAIQGEVFINYLESESFKEVFSEVPPELGETLWKDPRFKDYIPAADYMNDAGEVLIELLERSAPITIVDPKIFPPNVWNQRTLRAGEFVPAVSGSAGRIHDSFYKMQMAAPDPELYKFIDWVKGRIREILGLMPTVFGGDDAIPTAEQARRKLNQALMVLATTWNCFRSGWARARFNAIRLLAKHSNGQLWLSDGDPRTAQMKLVPEIGTLLDGGWYVECDQGIPMSWAQLRDFFESLFQGPPEKAQALGAMDPANISHLARGIGIAGWKVPGEQSREAIRSKIKDLLKASPTTDPMTGAPAPSEPFDNFLYDPQLTVTVVREWALDEGVALQGTPGYLNVLLWGKAALPPPMPPQLPPGKGGKGGEDGEGESPEAPLPPGPLGEPSPGSEVPGAPPAPLSPEDRNSVGPGPEMVM